MKIEPVVAGYSFHSNKLLLGFHKKHQMWLPLGGHIETNETPDEALRREFFEEAGLTITLLNKTKLKLKGNTIEILALPFHSDIHSVGNHYHSCQNYLCEIIGYPKIMLNKRELENADYFTKEDLKKPYISINIKNIGLLAFKRYGELK